MKRQNWLHLGWFTTPRINKRWFRFEWFLNWIEFDGFGLIWLERLHILISFWSNVSYILFYKPKNLPKYKNRTIFRWSSCQHWLESWVQEVDYNQLDIHLHHIPLWIPLCNHYRLDIKYFNSKNDTFVEKLTVRQSLKKYILYPFQVFFTRLHVPYSPQPQSKIQC